MKRRTEKKKENLQHLANVASTKHFVNNGELMGIIGREVRSESAVLGASPPEQLAGGARRVSCSHFFDMLSGENNVENVRVMPKRIG